MNYKKAEKVWRTSCPEEANGLVEHPAPRRRPKAALLWVKSKVK
jgi:hypothetical protein|tara:strand:- start:684 stop:815 length:132 start_codon:yes stop_codon:yes gene_type:complete